MHRHRHGGGCGCHGFGRHRYPNREEWIRALEEHQKDLEQEVADIADVLRRLKKEKAEAATP